jgi:membrane protease YdiL (CAAX protease family)
MVDQSTTGSPADLHITGAAIVFFLALLALSSAGTLPGDMGEFVLAGGMVAPFVILALLAYAGERHGWIRSISILWLLTLLFVLWAITVMLTIAPTATMTEGEEAFEAYLDSLPPSQVFTGFFAAFLAAAAGLIAFSRRFRGMLARILPFDPDSHIHMVALACVIALIAMPLVPLLVTGNAPFLNPDLQAALGIGLEEPGSTVKLDTYTLIWTVIGSFFLVGLFVKGTHNDSRTPRLVRPTLRQVIIGIVSGVVLVAAFWFLDEAVVVLFEAWGIPTTDETMVMNLFMVSFTPLAALIASISAGLGEELSVRGVIQPRFGIILSALVFTSLHAYQYAWDGLLSVLLVGICFGVLRNYANTSTSAISHAMYDLVLFALIIAGITSL